MEVEQFRSAGPSTNIYNVFSTFVEKIAFGEANIFNDLQDWKSYISQIKSKVVLRPCSRFCHEDGF